MDRSRATDRARELLERFGLADRAGEQVAGYSSGMRQRLALARALLPDPPLLLLDVPPPRPHWTPRRGRLRIMLASAIAICAAGAAVILLVWLS